MYAHELLLRIHSLIIQVFAVAVINLYIVAVTAIDGNNYCGGYKFKYRPLQF